MNILQLINVDKINTSCKHVMKALDFQRPDINPVEPSAGMDIGELKRKYGKKLAYIGGSL